MNDKQIEDRLDEIMEEKIMAEATEPHKVECSWCGAELGVIYTKPGQYHPLAVSHGICKACAVKMEEELNDA